MEGVGVLPGGCAPAVDAAKAAGQPTPCQVSGSEHPAAARAAAARNAGNAIRVVVIRQFLACVNPARGADPDRVTDDVDIAVRLTRVVDVSRDVSAASRVARPAGVDGEDPDSLPGQVALLAAPGLRLGDKLSFISDNSGTFVDPLAGLEAPAAV